MSTGGGGFAGSGFPNEGTGGGAAVRGAIDCGFSKAEEKVRLFPWFAKLPPPRCVLLYAAFGRANAPGFEVREPPE